MTKQITIDPAQMRATTVLRAPEIPINAYVSDPAAEAAQYGGWNYLAIQAVAKQAAQRAAQADEGK